jgi:hypothetical protein
MVKLWQILETGRPPGLPDQLFRLGSRCPVTVPRGATVRAANLGSPRCHHRFINRTYLSGVERSERNVSIDDIARIARGLKVKAWSLLDDSVKS